MKTGLRRLEIKCYFGDPIFENLPGNIPPDTPRSSCLRLLVSHPPNKIMLTLLQHDLCTTKHPKMGGNQTIQLCSLVITLFIVSICFVRSSRDPHVRLIIGTLSTFLETPRILHAFVVVWQFALCDFLFFQQSRTVKSYHETLDFPHRQWIILRISRKALQHYLFISSILRHH